MKKQTSRSGKGVLWVEKFNFCIYKEKERRYVKQYRKQACSLTKNATCILEYGKKPEQALHRGNVPCAERTFASVGSGVRPAVP